MSIKSFMMEDKKGQISTTKFWANIGYASLIGTFIYSVVASVPIDPTLMLIFGTIVVGNRTAAKMIKDFKPTAK